MCLIAVARKGIETIPPALLDNARAHNVDGWGYMFASGGRVIANRTLDKFDTVELPVGVPLAVHFRFASQGKVSKANCHPYAILTHEKHGADLYLMHNGTMHSMGSNSRSDTREFCEDILRPLLARNPRLVRTKAFSSVIKAFAGSYDKFVILEGCGKWHVVNPTQGFWDADHKAWFSNEYSIKPKLVPATGGYYNAATYAWESEAPGYLGCAKASTPVYTASKPWKPEEHGMHLDPITGAWTKDGYRKCKDGTYRSQLAIDAMNVLEHATKGPCLTKEDADKARVAYLTPPATQNLMQWQDFEVERLTSQELYEAVCDDPEGAAAYIEHEMKHGRGVGYE